MDTHYIDVTSSHFYLTYYRYDKYVACTPISIKELGKAIDQDSFYMMRILRLPGATKELLYDVAEHIKKLKPRNKINWESTFTKVDSYFKQEDLTSIQ